MGSAGTSAYRSHAVPLLRVFAITLMVIPSDTIIRSIGAGGYPAGLVGLFAFGVFMAATLLGLHNPLEHRNPVRSVLCLVWIVVLASYVLMDRSALTGVELAAADRFIMQLAVITGVALVAAECLTSLHDVRRVLRALIWGGAFCGAVAALQFWISLDITSFLRALPGFSLNFDNPTMIDREALDRVTGTAIHPIEMGVVCGMLLPLAIYLAIYDTDRSSKARWAPVVLIAIGITTSVSRSAVLAAAVSLLVLVALMPVRQRIVALCAVPFGLVGVFMAAPGVIRTLTAFFQASGSDPSVQTRTMDYPLAESLVREAPWFGHGPGTYIPENLLDVFDNAYLKLGVELGLAGLFIWVAFLVLPVVFALVARKRTDDSELRLLCAALAGTALAGAASSFTFDSFSFPMFTNVFALSIGLVGAAYRLALQGAPATARANGTSQRPVRAGTVLPARG